MRDGVLLLWRVFEVKASDWSLGAECFAIWDFEEYINRKESQSMNTTAKGNKPRRIPESAKRGRKFVEVAQKPGKGEDSQKFQRTVPKACTFWCDNSEVEYIFSLQELGVPYSWPSGPRTEVLVDN
jgi:hypothetical protein